MGWLFTQKHKGVSVKDFFVEHFAPLEIVECKVKNMKTAYLAVRFTDGPKKGKVIGVVCLLEYKKNDWCNFGYKDMEEGMGPNEVECPKSVLEKLSPLDEIYSDITSDAYQWAKKWRDSCWANVHKKKLKLSKGMMIKFPYDLEFGSDRIKLNTFFCTDPKRGQFVSNGSLVRLPRRIINNAYDQGLLEIREIRESA